MRFYLLFFFVLIALSSFAQNKKVLTFDHMLNWNSIKSSGITNDGTYVVYEMGPLLGDQQIIVYNTTTNTSDTLHQTSGPTLSPDGNFLVATKKAPYLKLRQAKLDEVKKDDLPKDSTIIYHFISKNTLVFPKADSTLSSQKEGFMAGVLFKKEKDKEETNDTTELEPELDTEVEEAADSISVPKELGKTLIIYNGKTGDTTQVNSVTEFSISQKENQLAYIQQFELDSVTSSSCKIWKNQSQYSQILFSKQGYVKKLSFSEDGQQLAFIFSNDTSKVKSYSLYCSENDQQATLLVSRETDGMPENYGLSENGKIEFSKNATLLYLGTAKIEAEEPKDSLTEDEKPKLDLWSWTDLRLQPQQLVELKKDKKKSFRAVWHLDTKKLVQLENENFNGIKTTPKLNTNYALLSNELPYLRESNWTGLWKKDLALIDLTTGETTEVSKAQFSYHFSAAGNYVFWFSEADSSYYTYSLELGTTTNISKNLPTKIYDELEDRPIIPSTYGTAGWTKDDRYVLVYDRYDIWQVDPLAQKKPVNLTDGFGRTTQTELRIVDLDEENEFIELDQAILLHGVNQINNVSTFYEFSKNKKNPFKVLMQGDYKFSTPKKARNADLLLWTKENFKLFPDLIVSELDFKKQTIFSSANPQQAEYNWGSNEACSWKSFRGETLNGLIYKPENFDPSKKYPMIVYFYERNFDRQHSHRIPAPSRSTINPTFYTSNGYLVFIPDISYVDGYPGQSAYDCIISGVQSLISQYNWIDAEHMALQGQSWGGYQTAYLVTQTDLFAAAMGGAVVSNMTSAYGGIRWKSGLNRMFQYEKTQSRIGGTLWEKPLLYIENSPLFHAPKVNTPILLMHNDKDGAVPWYQGIEYFVALRRLNKAVWMINYNGQPHNLEANAIANRLDLSKRMKQFFDHYLKNEPAPQWMTDGIPAMEKGKNLGY